MLSPTGIVSPRISVMCNGIVAWLIAQLTMGIVFLDDDSKCSSNAAPFGLAIWNLTSFCWKAHGFLHHWNGTNANSPGANEHRSTGEHMMGWTHHGTCASNG